MISRDDECRVVERDDRSAAAEGIGGVSACLGIVTARSTAAHQLRRALTRASIAEIDRKFAGVICASGI
jgi:hypothetical protein